MTTAKKSSTHAKSTTSAPKKHAKTSPSTIRFDIIVPAVFAVAIIIVVLIFAQSAVQPSDQSSQSVVAYVNGAPIYQSQVDEFARLAQQVSPDLPQEIILNQTIVIHLLRTQAQQQGIVIDDFQVELLLAQREAQLKAQFGEEQFVELLAQQGLTPEQFRDIERQSIKDDYLFSTLLEQNVPAPQADEDELREFYDQNPAYFNIPQQRDLAHILICYQGATACQEQTTRQDAEQMAQTIADSVTMQTMSEHPQFQQIGLATQDMLVEEFSNVAFNMDVGQISQPVESEFGFHIITVNEIIPPQQLSFEEVKDELAMQFTAGALQEAQRQYMLDLFNNAEIVLVQ